MKLQDNDKFAVYYLLFFRRSWLSFIFCFTVTFLHKETTFLLQKYIYAKRHQKEKQQQKKNTTYLKLKTWIILLTYTLYTSITNKNKWEFQLEWLFIHYSLSGWNFEIMVSTDGGKPENQRKNPRSRDENQQESQPADNIVSENLTQAILVKGVIAQCAIPGPQLVEKSWLTLIQD